MTSADLSKRPDQVAKMFDQVAPGYDLTNNILSLWQTPLWRRATFNAVSPWPGERVLDIAAGTGTSSVPFYDAGADVVSADFSRGMIEVGKRRYPFLDFEYADATDLPFPDGSFDAVTISFGLRNVADVERALAEMLRVLRPGGRVVICEFSRPVWTPFTRLYDAYLSRVLPLGARLFGSNVSAYPYLAESIRDWYPQRELGRLMVRTGFVNVQYRNLTGGIVALHRGFVPEGSDASGKD